MRTTALNRLCIPECVLKLAHSVAHVDPETHSVAQHYSPEFYQAYETSGSCISDAYIIPMMHHTQLWGAFFPWLSAFTHKNALIIFPHRFIPNFN